MSNRDKFAQLLLAHESAVEVDYANYCNGTASKSAATGRELLAFVDQLTTRNAELHNEVVCLKDAVEWDKAATRVTAARNAELEAEVARLRDYLSVIEKQVSCRGDDYKARVDQLQTIARNALKESGL